MITEYRQGLMVGCAVTLGATGHWVGCVILIAAAVGTATWQVTNRKEKHDGSDRR